MAKSKKLFFKYSILWLVIISTACEKIINYDIPEDELGTVINGIFCQDSILKLNVSKSIHILDTAKSYFIKDASVELFENDLLVENLEYLSKGFYSTNSFVPKAGNEYKIVVNVEGKKECTAVCSVPEPIEIFSIDTSHTDLIEYGYYFGKKLNCIITINDPATIPNYYELVVYKKEILYFSEMDSLIFLKPVRFETDDRIIELYRVSDGVYPFNIEPETESVEGEYAIFSDNLLDGKKVSVKFNIKIYSGIYEQYDTYYFYLNSITRDYYLYLKSLAQYYLAQGHPFKEPVQVYSNINGGIGIFAGYSSFMDSVVVANF